MTKNIDEGSIVGGVPAMVIGNTSQLDIAYRNGKVQ